MSDHFRHLTGTSLFMKSDSDGTKDGFYNKMPLGIKSPAEGIQHFTNWGNISKTLEIDNLVRLEDGQVNKVLFRQRVNFNFISWSESKQDIVNSSLQVDAGFEDTWVPNKVKILDDVAFVAQDEYTDIVRDDIPLFDIGFKQYAVKVTDTVNCGSIENSSQILGSLIAVSPDLPGTYENYYWTKGFAQADGSTDTYYSHINFDYKRPTAMTGASLWRQDYQNCILKVKIGRPGLGSFIGYLIYGGVLKNDFHNLMEETGIGLNFRDIRYGSLVDDVFKNESAQEINQDPLAYAHGPGYPPGGYAARFGLGYGPPEPQGIAGESFAMGDLQDGAVIGYYYLIPQKLTLQDEDIPDGASRDDYPIDEHFVDKFEDLSQRAQDLVQQGLIPDPRDERYGFLNLGKRTFGSDACYGSRNSPVGIQISLRKEILASELDDFTNGVVGSKNPFTLEKSFTQTEYGSTIHVGLYSASTFVTAEKFIQLTPVRKCGKVDIYKRKRSFITSSLNGKLISEDHGLNNGDIIEIKNVLFSESANSFSSKHPLNGIKYVRVEDNDSFVAYDDQALSRPSNLTQIRTFDGVSWKSISNLDFQSGAGWKFEGSLFSPLGKNGHTLAPRGDDITVAQAHPDTFFTRKRPKELDGNLAVPTERSFGWEKPQLGGVYLDFTYNADPANIDRVSVFNLKWAENIDQNFENVLNPNMNTSNPGHQFRNIPFSIDLGAFSDPRSSWMDYFSGAFFGSDIDVKFSHKTGSSSVYILAVGERGSDSAVDLFGVSEGYSEVGPWSVINNHPTYYSLGKAKKVPSTLPRGRTHIFKFVLDQYNNLTEITHQNTVFGGGKAAVSDVIFYNDAGEVKRFDLIKEPVPWNKYEGGTGHKTNRGSYWFLSFGLDLQFEDLFGLEYEGRVFAPYNYSQGQVDVQNSNYWARSAVVNWANIPISEWRVNCLGDRFIKTNTEDSWHYALLAKNKYLYSYQMVPESLLDSRVETSFGRRLGNISCFHFGTVVPNIKPYSVFGGEDVSPGGFNPNAIGFGSSYYISVFDAINLGNGQEFITQNDLSETLTFTPYETIEREWDSTSLSDSELIDFKTFHARRAMIYPYVDSFGKSTALKVDKSIQDLDSSAIGFTVYNDLPKVVVVSGSTSRSNIPFYKPEKRGINGSLDFSQDEIKGEQTKSQIGQLQANFLYPASNRGYINADFMFINSGGSDCGRFFRNLTLQRSNASSGLFAGPGSDPPAGDQYQRALRPGSPAGFGYREVATSCALSAMQIEWVGNELVWTDQELYNGRSVVNILKFNDSGARCFEPSHKIVNNFIDKRYVDNFGPPTAFNTGDGFGVNFCYDGSLFVTNSRSTKTELGLSIDSEFLGQDGRVSSSRNFHRARTSFDRVYSSGYLSNITKYAFWEYAVRAETKDYRDEFDQVFSATTGLARFDRLDFLNVYEKINDSFFEVQKISASINRDFRDYYSGAILDSGSHLLPISGTVNYSNKSFNSSTWNLDFQNRYQISDGRIIFKDVLEYCLFEKNPGVSTSPISQTSSVSACYPYLAVSEDTKYGQKYFSDTSLEYNYIPSAQTSYECASYGGSPSTFNTSKTPVIYFDVDLDDLDDVQSITIDFEIEDDSIFSEFGILDLSSLSSVSERTDNIIPRLVVYGQDPRETIIKNGPKDANTDPQRLLLTDDSTRPTYEQGIYTGAPYKYFDHLTYYGYNFPGAFRGGAQDLFFYYRPNFFDSDAASKVDTVFGLPDKDGFLFSDSEGGLGPFYDRTTNRLNSAGNPSYFTFGDSYIVRFGDPYSPDFEFSSANTISAYSRFAGLFMPIASADGYSVTIEAAELRDLLINGHVVRDVDRPGQFFNSFNDFQNVYRDASGKKTLAIGFVLTNLTYGHGKIEWEEPASFSLGPIRSISDRRGNHRYPYQPHVNFYDPIALADDTSPYVWNGKQIEYQLRATVRDVSVKLNKVERGKPRFISKYNKAATFSWHNAAKPLAREVEKHSPYSLLVDEDLYFGTDSLVPVANVPLNKINSSYNPPYRIEKDEVAKFKNPIISISKESQAFPFVDDKEILTTEITNRATSILNNFQPAVQTQIYLNRHTGSLIYSDDRSYFTQRNFVGSFDINNSERDRFLSLYINCVPQKKKDISLFTEAHVPLNNDADLFVDGIGRASSDTSLFIGVRSDDKDMSLFIDPPFMAGMHLFTYEKAPSGTMPLYHQGPKQEGEMTLTFAKPPSGLAPLYTKGPIQDTNDMRLYMVSTHEEGLPLYTRGIGFSDKRMSLFIDSFGVHSDDISLTFSAGHSGTMPLFMANHNKPTANLDLVMPSTIDDANDDITLFIARNGHVETNTLFVKSQHYFNTEDSDLSPTLFIDGPTNINDDGTDLYISGPVTGTKNDVDLYVRSIFPSGQMSLVTSPIGRVFTTMPLHMANAQERMPLYLYNLDGSITTLNISGESTDSDSRMGLFMSNKQLEESFDMFISAPKTDTISLSVGGSIDESAAGFASLWTGKQAHINNGLSMFVQNSKLDSASSQGVTFNSSDMSLRVAGGFSTSYEQDETLFLLGQPFESGNNNADLFMKVDEPVLGEGGNILESGKLITFIEGNNDANVYYKNNDSSSLYIVNRSLDNTSADLFIKRPNEFGTTLYVQSLISSGVADLYVSGAYIASDEIGLFIDTPEASGMDMFTRGYLE